MHPSLGTPGIDNDDKYVHCCFLQVCWWL